MGREVRMVDPTWEHPKKPNGRYTPLMNRSYLKSAQEDWDTNYDETVRQVSKYYQDFKAFHDDYGNRPNDSSYMPDFGDKATHYCMYEDTSEGTPISPAFETPEELAHWLADTNASSMGPLTASYEQWLATIKQGWAVSGVFTPETGFISGVEFNGVKE